MQEWNTRKTDEVSVDLLRLVRAVWKKAWLIVLAVVILGTAAFLYSKLLITPTYRAGFTAYVNNRQNSDNMISTNIMLSLPGTECKCIGVTSPTPGDGKSTTASNLAITLAQIGKRVLLIDSDMRLPTVSGRFRITATPGLSDFLVGEARIEDAVRNVEKYGIQVLPAGSIPPRSHRLAGIQADESAHRRAEKQL